MLINSGRLRTTDAKVDNSGEVLRRVWQEVKSVFRSICPVRVIGDRDLLIDALRGFCFMLMTANHLPGNILATFSNPQYGPFGFFTSASGFVFLSGLVAGSAYLNYGRTHGFEAMNSRIWRRFWDVYVAQMLLYFTLFVAVYLRCRSSASWQLDLMIQAPVKAAVFGVALLYEPMFLGILPMYCLYLAATPLLLKLMRMGKVNWILGGSTALWFISGLVVRLPNGSGSIAFGAFNPLTYQILFVFGLAFGTRYVTMERLMGAAKRKIAGLVFAITSLFWLLRMGYALNPTIEDFVNRYQKLFSVVHFGPLRLLNFAVFSVALYCLFENKRWSRCQHPAFRWLAFLGQHSLPVCVWSILTTYAVMALLPQDPAWGARFLAMILAVGSLTVPAFLHVQYRQYRKKVSASASLEATA